MAYNPELWESVRTVLTAASEQRFIDLLHVAGLDPKTDLRGGDLRNCDLSGQDFAGCDFTGTDVTGVDFAETILNGADLSGAIGLDHARNVDRAVRDRHTKWPASILVPEWADAAGRDAFGPWASFTITPKTGPSVIQRLRWIPPGTFRIGSPRREPGRYDDEDKGTHITIARGFWLFETPCTQALWTAVMGENDNPSEFKSPNRPIETVSFEDAQRFIRRLNNRRKKRRLSLALPSEAQWEYACRAGTKTATYAGPMRILGDNNAPVLDEIAWYAGNCGRDFDLANGLDISDWPARQYQDARGGTHPVGLKKPNGWGLHDMLGNVWEWCADEWHENHEGIPADGTARDSGSSAAGRVIRGGSWNGDARDVRAACRGGGGPSNRFDILGFRCARGHLA
jgi:formylglycine-generating enzyme required for sulfatase activity